MMVSSVFRATDRDLAMRGGLFHGEAESGGPISPREFYEQFWSRTATRREAAPDTLFF
ncbi:MAG: hypothetical protein H0X47_10410 [Nitrospirales bacterium]|nr:hypothetical protein [Nitrospirales bacterium]